MILFDKIDKWYTNEIGDITLTKAVDSGRLCHAYLFYGQKGVGKKTMCFNFAMKIFCKSENKPCYECESCKKMINGNHPDFFCITDKTTKKSIHIEQIRNLKNDAYIKPNESEYKIYLIAEIENMTLEAANAFLKLLEEPPNNVIILLTSISKKAVLPTIYSRCVPFLMYPLTVNQCVSALMDKYPLVSEDRIRQIALLTNGSIGAAIEYIGNERFDELINISKEIFINIVNHKEYKNLVICVKHIKDKKIFIELINIIILFLRQLLLLKSEINRADYGEFLECVTDIALKFTTEQLLNIYSSLQKYILDIENNINLNLLINHFCSNLAEIVR